MQNECKPDDDDDDDDEVWNKWEKNPFSDEHKSLNRRIYFLQRKGKKKKAEFC